MEQGGEVIFIDAIIYYPTDEKGIKQINREIAGFHSAVAIKYMNDTLLLSLQQQVKMLDSLMQDIIILHNLHK